LVKGRGFLPQLGERVPEAASCRRRLKGTSSMFSFQDFLSGGLASFQQAQAQAQQQQQQPGQTGVPPASKRFLAGLKDIQVTADDLLEENNKECLVCLEEQKVGGLACKLPCGHLYHRACVTDWLHRHCTCPCCRFEVESDDVEYEKDRRLRMKKRKLRMRADEINHKTLGEMRELCRSLQVSIVGCLEKSEIVDRLVKSGKIEITEAAPVLEMKKSDFFAKGVGELRHMLLSYGLSDEGALEKRELRSRLEESGRLVIVDDDDDGEEPSRAGGGAASAEARPAVQGAGATKSSSREPAVPSPKQARGSEPMKLTTTLLASLPVRDIKNILSAHSIDASRCLERRDMIDLMKADARFEIIED